jgi:hypothetical protein
MRRSGSRQRYLLLALSAFWVALLGLVLCALQGIAGYPFRKTIALDPTKLVPAGPFGYSSALPAMYSPKGPQTASLKLLEDGKIFSSYSSKETDVMSIGQGIFSIPGEGRLTFSTADNSDPRTNRRNYSVDLPLRLSKWALPICFAAWVTTIVFLFLNQPDRRGALLVWSRRLRVALGSIVALFGKWPAIILSVPSIYLLSSYPPLWKDVDAIAQLTLPASSANILHFPPTYCFLGRIPFAIASWMTAPADLQPFRSLFDQQEPSLAGIYLLIVLQHIALIASLTYTVTSLTRNRMLRGLFALLLASVSGLFAQTQCAGSEALSVSATFAVLAAGLSIARGSGPVAWIVYSLALFLAIGSRHINLLLVLWLPVTLALLGLTTKIGWFPSLGQAFRWKTWLATIAIGVLTVGLNIWVARSMIAAVHDEYRSTLGATLSDRIATFLGKLSTSDRLQLARDLSSKTSDSRLRIAIESLATVGSYSDGTAQTVAAELVREHVPAAEIRAETDRIVLAATMRYLMTFHPVLLKVIWADFTRGFLQADNAKIAFAPFYENWWGADDRLKRPDAWVTLKALPSVHLNQAAVVMDAARRDPYVNFGRGLPLGALIVLVIFLSGAVSIINREISGTVLIGWSALAIGIVVFAANCVCVFYLDRYALPLLITSVFALSASLVPLTEKENGWMVCKLAFSRARQKIFHWQRLSSRI